MMKRNSIKLGVGLMSLMAIGGGAAQARASSDTAVAGGSTLTQLSFEMAMAQAAQVEDIPPDTQPAQPARPNTTIGKETVGPDGLVEGAAYIEADQIARGVV